MVPLAILVALAVAGERLSGGESDKMVPRQQAAAAAAATTAYYVSCSKGDDTAAGSLAAPFRSLARARDAIRAARSIQRSGGGSPHAAAAVFVRGGVCELAHPLELDARDSAAVWSAYQGESVLISAGITVPPSSLVHSAGVCTVDLTALNLTKNDTGVLNPRGFPGGGGAGIALWRYERSAMELFYRPAAAGRAAAGRDQNYNAADAQMVLARYPDLAHGPSNPSTSDWTQIHSVTAGTRTIGLSTAMAKRVLQWQGQQASRGDIMTHGLWSGTNWADSHRPVTSIQVNHSTSSAQGGAQLVLGEDEPAFHGYVTNPARGANFYAYNIEAELNALGEYYLDRQTLQLSFIPPRAANGGVDPEPVVVAREAKHLPGGLDNGDDAHGCTQLKHQTCLKGERAIKIIPHSRNATRCCEACTADARCFSYSLNHGLQNCYLHPRGHHNESAGNCDAGVVRGGAGPSPTPTPPRPPTPPPPPSPPPSPRAAGSYHLSVADAVLDLRGATDVRFVGLELRHARGPGVMLSECQRVVLDGCTVADK
jgi:hypothetical protein